MENEGCAKHRRLPDIQSERVPRNNFSLSATVSGSDQVSVDSSDLSYEDDEYFTPKHLAITAPRQSSSIVCLLTAARLYLNSAPD